VVAGVDGIALTLAGTRQEVARTGNGRLIAKTIRESVEYGLEHRDDALKYAMQFARDMETELADQFVACM